MSRSKPLRDSHAIHRSTLCPGLHVVYVAHEIVAVLRLKGSQATIERIKTGTRDDGLGEYTPAPFGLKSAYDSLADAASVAVGEWERLRAAA